MDTDSPEGAVASRLEWAEVADRLSGERTLWLGTVSPEGAPHVAPVWGAVSKGVLFTFTSRASRKARNIAQNPRVVIHGESGEDVLIVHGTLVDMGGPEAAQLAVAAFEAKYLLSGDSDYLPGHDVSVDVMYALTPDTALSWNLSSFEGSQRRWSASASGSVSRSA